MNYTVSLRKRSDTWSYQIFVNGKYHSSESGFKTKSEAKKTGDRAALKIKNPERSRESFKEIADIYIQDGSKEESTKETYEKWLKNYEAIYDIEMTKLSYMDVGPLIHDYYKNHKYSGTKSLLGFGRSIVKFAIINLDYDMKNPFDKVKIEEKPSKSKKKHTILTESEMFELFDKIEDDDIRFLTMCFGIAGMRISEARGLTFDSFIDDDVYVKQQYQSVKGENIIKEDTKSNDGIRKIPLHENLKAELLKRPRNINSKKLVVETFYRSTQIIPVYKKLGYDITPHSLRHAYATIALQNNLDIKTVAELIGDSVEVTMKTYAHVNTDMYEKARKVLTKRVTNLSETSETNT